jgi:hypothetical protein
MHIPRLTKKSVTRVTKQAGRGIDKRVKSTTQRIGKELGHRKLQLGKVKKAKHQKYRGLF